MTKLEVRDVLLVEAHRILKEEAKRAVQKIGKPIPQEARPGYLTDEDISILKQLGTANLDHPAMRKSMRASAARSEVRRCAAASEYSSAHKEPTGGNAACVHRSRGSRTHPWLE